MKEDRYFEAVDGLRGLAALVVLLWHYQHFYYVSPGVLIDTFQRSAQPGYPIFQIFYERGQYAVQLFWMLSGFVMAHVYLRTRTLKGLTFAKRRFARIFPLHWLTLCVVAALQGLSFVWVGQFQIYGFNDLYHFVLNVFGASYWGFQQGFSFNAPIWSVSVELLAYAVFVALFPVLIRLPASALAFALGCLLWTNFYKDTFIVSCAGYFFTGVTLWTLFYGPLKLRWCLHRAAPIVYVGVIFLMVRIGLTGGFETVFFALALLACAVWCDHHKRRSWRGARFLGDASFGLYLWHVPLQITVLICFQLYDVERSVLNAPWVLCAFVGATFVLAIVSFYAFERPLRRRLNRAW